jgi:hypothetical protein
MLRIFHLKLSGIRIFFTCHSLIYVLQELWSLLEFMMPDIFATGDVDLKKLLNAEDHELISHIKSILGPFILRRLKSDVMQQLVPKIQHVSGFILSYLQLVVLLCVSSFQPTFIIFAGKVCHHELRAI